MPSLSQSHITFGEKREEEEEGGKEELHSHAVEREGGGGKDKNGLLGKPGESFCCTITDTGSAYDRVTVDAHRLLFKRFWKIQIF